jgi:hypothetical protein
MAMEEPGAAAASASPVAESISSEIDSLFADAASDSASEESTTAAAEPNPQDSTVQPSSPIEFEPGDDAVEAEKPVAAKPAEPAVEAAPPVAEEDREGEEYEQRGKKWIRYPEARGKEVFAGYQAARSLQKELNLPGPVTAETVRTLVNDKSVLDNIDFDVMSTDPAEQARAFRYLFHTAKKAFEGGHTSHNPHETMADALLHAASNAAPEVVRGLEHRITENTFNKLYQKAVAAGLDTQAGKELLASVQRADQALTGQFRKRADLAQQPAPAADALSVRAQEVEQRANQIQEYESQRARREWDEFTGGTNVAIDDNVNGAIASILKPVAASLKNFPETQKNVEIRLIQEIKEAIAQDQKFGIERDRCFKQASIAGSESVRDGWRARIIQLYTSKAESVLRAKAPAILSESAQALKAKSDKTHERLKGTQQLRGTPAGGIAPNGTTAPGSSGGKFDSRSWAQEFESAFN